MAAPLAGPGLVLVTLAVAVSTLVSGCGGSSEPEQFPLPSGLPSSTAVPLVPLRTAGFRIKLPAAAEPYEQHLSADGRPVTGYKASDQAGGYFLISEVPNPGAAAIDLDGLVNASVGAVGGTLLGSRAVSFRGHPARDVRYTARLAGTDLTFFVLAVDVDNNLLQLQYAVPQKGLDQRPSLFDEVLDTLVLR